MKYIMFLEKKFVTGKDFYNYFYFFNCCIFIIIARGSFEISILFYYIFFIISFYLSAKVAKILKIKWKKKIYIIQTKFHITENFFKNIKKDAQVVIISSKEKRINTIKSNRFDYSLEIKNFLGFIWLKNLPYQSFKNNFVIINGNMRILNNYIIFFLKYLFNYEIIWWGHLRSTRPAQSLIE